MVYSASLGGTRELPTRHRETPAAKCQEWPYHRLGGGGLVVDGVGSGDGDWLRRRIGGAAPTSVGIGAR